jgi:hypothetical protein
LPLRRLMCGGMLWLGQSIKLALSGIWSIGVSKTGPKYQQ